jgi:hypothetical protein
MHHICGAKVSERVVRQFGKQSTSEHIEASNLSIGQKIKIKLFSPEIVFSEAVVKELDSEINVVNFIAKPSDNCYPGSHQVVLSISDEKTNQEHQSISFTVQVTDFAFDHVSRPLLSRLLSVALGAGSFSMFILTLFGQIDTTFGLTSGTVAGTLASAIYIRFNMLYQQQKTTGYP